MKPEFFWKLGETLRELRHALAAEAAHHEPPESCGCCEIPHTHCPPRCAGEIKWTIGRGAFPEASIVVRHTGTVAREFQFSATALSGLGVGTASLVVEPATAFLQPGQSAPVQVKLKDSLSLRACQDYRAEVLIKGSWEQCIRVHCHVAHDPFETVSIEQSDSLKDRFHALIHKPGIEWKIDRGVTPEGAITVHNTGGSAQTFTFDSTPLIGAGGAGASVVATPDSLELDRGETGVVRLRLENSMALSPCQTYHASLMIRGAYEQGVAILCRVEADASDHCHIEQGEAPTHLRAHHWYDHFQCTEPCVIAGA